MVCCCQATLAMLRKKHVDCVTELLTPDRAAAFAAVFDQDIRSVIYSFS
jgi:hypothetical protein